MKTYDPNEPVEVYSGSAWQAGMVKSLLEDSEIEAFLQDKIMGTLNPWWTSPGGSGAVKVFVAIKDQEKAKSIVSHYIENLKEE
jgi:hypothetical protein